MNNLYNTLQARETAALLGKRLGMALDYAGIPERDHAATVAAFCHITKATAKRWLSGQSLGRVGSSLGLFDLAHRLRIHVDWLPDASLDISVDTAHFAYIVQSWTPAQVEEARRMLDAMLEAQRVEESAGGGDVR